MNEFHVVLANLLGAWEKSRSGLPRNMQTFEYYKMWPCRPSFSQSSNADTILITLRGALLGSFSSNSLSAGSFEAL
jgi:hypothetical protein